MESTILVLTYWSLLMMSAMGFVLDRKTDVTLQSSSLNETNDKIDSVPLERDQRSTEECREPDEDQLEDMLSNWRTYPVKGYETIGEKYTKDSNKCDTMRTAKIQSGNAVNRKALCPWTMKTTITNANRYPSRISYAECICKSCKGGTCVPVPQPQRALYKTKCVDGVYQYELRSVEVSVACVCERSSTA